MEDYRPQIQKSNRHLSQVLPLRLKGYREEMWQNEILHRLPAAPAHRHRLPRLPRQAAAAPPHAPALQPLDEPVP